MLEHVEGHDGHGVISDVRESSERRMKAEAKKPNKTHTDLVLFHFFASDFILRSVR